MKLETSISEENDGLLRRAIQHHKAGNLSDALHLYEIVISRDPSNPGAHANVALILATRGRYADAIKVLERGIASGANDTVVYCALGNCFAASNQSDHAIEAYQQALKLKPDFAEAHFRLAFILCHVGRLAEGFGHFIQRAKLVHGSASGLPPAKPEPEHKIKHDREQREYLLDKLGSARSFHLENGERLDGPAVNPLNSTAAVAERWRSSSPQYVIIDNFLTVPALNRLRSYCAGSTIWRRIYSAGYLGATPEDGLSCPLLAQIVEEVRSTYAEILGPHPFRYLGAFKYDSALSTGTNTHADNSAVNFNLYIAPDEANLDAETGGMDLWDVAMPPDVDMRIYNGNEVAAREFITRAGGRLTVIPHRANRAVLFKSDLFHKTSKCMFREGYLNKRINISLLFGERLPST